MVIDVNGNPQSGRQMGLPGPGWAEEGHVLLAGDEVQSAKMGDQVPFQTAGVVEVEFLQRLRPRKRAARIRPSPLALGEEFVECGLVLRPEPDL